jgi:hypothetical protein
MATDQSLCLMCGGCRTCLRTHSLTCGNKLPRRTDFYWFWLRRPDMLCGLTSSGHGKMPLLARRLGVLTRPRVQISRESRIRNSTCNCEHQPEHVRTLYFSREDLSSASCPFGATIAAAGVFYLCVKAAVSVYVHASIDFGDLMMNAFNVYLFHLHRVHKHIPHYMASFHDAKLSSWCKP